MMGPIDNGEPPTAVKPRVRQRLGIVKEEALTF